jgi:putative ABC transport system permease protein
MIFSTFRFALRSIRKNKLLASINVLGLTIGISACLTIFLMVSYELSFDRFQPDGDRIYRIYTTFKGHFTGVNRGAATGFVNEIRENFSGVEAVTNFHTFSSKVFIPEGTSAPKEFKTGTNAIFATPEYFEVFTFHEWLKGDPKSALAQPSTVVLTESRARTYFGNIPLNDLLGRVVIYRDSIETTVTGIVRDVTANSDFNFSEYISLTTNEQIKGRKIFKADDWKGTNTSSQLFVKLKENVTAQTLEPQLSKVADLYREQNKDANWFVIPTLQALRDLHFNTELGIFNGSRSVADRSTFQVLVIIAVLLLAIAVINFVNLETAQASRRAKEVGVRKVLGSSRSLLVGHFLMESFIVTCSAVLCSVVVSWGCLIYFADFISTGVSLDLFSSTVIAFLILCTVGVSLLAGIYPAFVLSSCQPALALKNQLHVRSGSSGSAFIRKGLTVFQFSFSQVLIVFTVAISMQIHFMVNKDLGFDSNAVITFNAPWQEPIEKRGVLKNELDRISAIDMVSMHNSPPSAADFSSFIAEYNNGKEVLKHTVYDKAGDASYLDLYGIELVAGRNIVVGDNSHEYLINETYLHVLGFESPHDALGKTLDKDKVIVGVMKDFHSLSLHSPIQPVVIRSVPQAHSSFGLKFNSSEDVSALQAKIALVEEAWTKIYPDHKFSYTFMDDKIKRFYETEERTGMLAKTATGIAILISCLGLFGLSSFTVIRRTKEIGVRKVLGASVESILVLLSKDFLALVVIAFVIAAPFAYYGVTWWLEKFAYKMEVTIWLFLVAAAASVITAFLTISFRTISAAKADPVRSLRCE